MWPRSGKATMRLGLRGPRVEGTEYGKGGGEREVSLTAPVLEAALIPREGSGERKICVKRSVVGGSVLYEEGKAFPLAQDVVKGAQQTFTGCDGMY